LFFYYQAYNESDSVSFWFRQRPNQSGVYKYVIHPTAPDEFTFPSGSLADRFGSVDSNQTLNIEVDKQLHITGSLDYKRLEGVYPPFFSGYWVGYTAKFHLSDEP
jgi:hypothetical protein